MKWVLCWVNLPPENACVNACVSPSPESVCENRLCYDAVIRHTFHHWIISAVIIHSQEDPTCTHTSGCLTTSAVTRPVCFLSLSLSLDGIWQCEHTNWRHLCPPSLHAVSCESRQQRYLQHASASIYILAHLFKSQ